MHVMQTWEQTGVFDPTNPNQIIREPNNIGIPGGAYASFYFNKVPTKTQQVLGGLGDFSAWPVWSQVLIVGSLAAVVGFYGTKIVGPKIGLSGFAHDRKTTYRRSKVRRGRGGRFVGFTRAA